MKHNVASVASTLLESIILYIVVVYIGDPKFRYGRYVLHFWSEFLWTLVCGCCIIKPRKEHIMDITFCGFRIRIYQDPKVPKVAHLYITSRDGNTFYVLIQDMGKRVR